MFIKFVIESYKVLLLFVLINSMFFKIISLSIGKLFSKIKSIYRYCLKI